MNVSLNSTLEQIIAEKIASGEYASPGEVIQEALRLLDERDSSRAARLGHLREEIRRGIDQADEGKTRKFDHEALKQRLQSGNP